MSIQPAKNATATSCTVNEDATLHEENVKIGQKRKRIRPPLREIKMEIAGFVDDPIYQKNFLEMRQWKDRWVSLVRVFSTSVSVDIRKELQHWTFSQHHEGSSQKNVHESCNNLPLSSSSSSFIFRSPVYSLSFNGVPILSRDIRLPQREGGRKPIKNGGKGDEKGEGACVPSELTCLYDDNNDAESDGVATSTADLVSSFMKYEFLGRKFAQQRAAKKGEIPCCSTSPLLIRPYYDEPTRTVSFLVADRTTKCAAIIDPNLIFLELYISEIHGFHLDLLYICLTHLPFDRCGCFYELSTCFPSARIIVSQQPLVASSKKSASANLILPLSKESSGRYCLRCLSTAGYAPEGMTYFLCHCRESASSIQLGEQSDTSKKCESTLEEEPAQHVPCEYTIEGCDETLIAFTGPTLGLDCIPRVDLSEDGQHCITDAVVIRQRQLQLYNSVQKILSHLQTDTVLMPCHGGYNPCTNSLELFWAAHFGDIKRSQKKLMDAFQSEESFLAYSAFQHALPLPFAFAVIREKNLSAMKKWQEVNGENKTSFEMKTLQNSNFEELTSAQILSLLKSDKRKWSQGILQTDFPPINTTDLLPLVLDVRSQDSYLHRRIYPSINIAMSWPVEAREAKKAELWISALLLPRQPLIVIAPGEKTAAVKRRFQRIGYERISVLEESNIPQELWNRNPWRRLQSYDDMKVLDLDKKTTDEEGSKVHHPGTSRSWVVDCRTSYEFQNGSHYNSVLKPIAEIRRMLMHTLHALQSSRKRGEKQEFRSVSEAVLHVLTCPFAHFTNTNNSGTIELASSEAKNSLSCVEESDSSMTKLLVSSSSVGRGGAINDAKSSTTINQCPGFRQRSENCPSARCISIYCAGGYRSHIVASVLQYLLVACEEAEGNSSSAMIEICDIVGGALKIMTHRPDLWIVKDRTIICVS